MASYYLTPEAELDLQDIWDFIHKDNERAADRLLGQLIEDMQRLADNPGMGPQREELLPGLRSWPRGSYLIFYEPHPDGIQVLRILHGARPLDRLF